MMRKANETGEHVFLGKVGNKQRREEFFSLYSFESCESKRAIAVPKAQGFAFFFLIYLGFGFLPFVWSCVWIL